MGELTSLPNIGPIVEKQLLDVGIENYEQLKEIGAEEAWLRIQKKQTLPLVFIDYWP